MQPDCKSLSENSPPKKKLKNPTLTCREEIEHETEAQTIAAIKRKMETKSKSKDEKHPNPARDQTTRKKETKPWFPSNPNSD
jgi:hypothetical protein